MNFMLSNINMDVVCQFKEVNDAENVIKTEQFGCWPTGHIFHIQVIYITGSYCHAGRINVLLYYASLQKHKSILSMKAKFVMQECSV